MSQINHFSNVVPGWPQFGPKLLCLLLLIAVQIIAIVQIIAVQIIAMGLEIIKKKRLEPKIENRSDLDETLHSDHQFSQIFWWEWSGGLKMANKGKHKFPTFSKKS